MARRVKVRSEAARRVEAAYYRTCGGVQINIMNIPKVFAAGEAAMAEGVDDEELGRRIRAFVDGIRVGP